MKLERESDDEKNQNKKSAGVPKASVNHSRQDFCIYIYLDSTVPSGGPSVAPAEGLLIFCTLAWEQGNKFDNILVESRCGFGRNGQASKDLTIRYKAPE